MHDTPSSIHKHDEADMTVPEVFWDRYDHMPSELEKREAALAKDPMYAYLYAKQVLGKRFPAGEAAIATSTRYAYFYAYYVIDGRFPLGEPAIAKDPRRSKDYAVFVIHKRFPLGEDIIATDINYSYDYAYQLNQPFKKGEAKIATNAEYSYLYAHWVLKKRFPLGEKIIAKNIYYKDEYNKEFGTDL